MIEDARALPDGQALAADVCIVGAGPAGITLARALEGRGLAVCVFESGGFEFEPATQALYEGENTGHPYYPLDVTRLRYFGGTSNHWGGMSAPLLPMDFERRSWVPDSGWPFDQAELQPYYERAHPICDLGPFDYTPAGFEERAGTTPLPLPDDVFRISMVQYSPPTRFGEKYRAALQKSGDVRVYLHANVLEIVADAGGQRVAALRLATLAGKTFTARARVYVLATGGLENPRLLLLSNGVQHEGLGNAHGLVGRFFLEHPGCACGTLLPADPGLDLRLFDRELRRTPGIRARAMLVLTEAVQRREQLPTAAVFLTPRYRPSEGFDALKALLGRNGSRPEADLTDDLAAVIGDLDGIGAAAWRRVFGGSAPIRDVDVYINWEQAPRAESRVRLTSDRDAFGQNRIALHWVVAPADQEVVIKVLDLLAHEVGSAGLGRVRALPSPDVWFGATDGNHHHMGTTRMHDDPKRGVVDATGRVHGLENLYVAGSSVFPTAGFVNPTLTLVALTLRLADHLQRRLGSP